VKCYIDNYMRLQSCIRNVNTQFRSRASQLLATARICICRFQFGGVRSAKAAFSVLIYVLLRISLWCQVPSSKQSSPIGFQARAVVSLGFLVNYRLRPVEQSAAPVHSPTAMVPVCRFRVFRLCVDCCR
jgi:hypothetical protein